MGKARTTMIITKSLLSGSQVATVLPGFGEALAASRASLHARLWHRDCSFSKGECRPFSTEKEVTAVGVQKKDEATTAINANTTTTQAAENHHTQDAPPDPAIRFMQALQALYPDLHKTDEMLRLSPTFAVREGDTKVVNNPHPQVEQEPPDPESPRPSQPHQKQSPKHPGPQVPPQQPRQVQIQLPRPVPGSHPPRIRSRAPGSYLSRPVAVSSLKEKTDSSVSVPIDWRPHSRSPPKRHDLFDGTRHIAFNQPPEMRTLIRNAVPVTHLGSEATSPHLSDSPALMSSPSTTPPPPLTTEEVIKNPPVVSSSSSRDGGNAPGKQKRTAIVTGASSEIGRAIALRLIQADECSDVVLVTRRKENLARHWGEEFVDPCPPVAGLKVGSSKTSSPLQKGIKQEDQLSKQEREQEDREEGDHSHEPKAPATAAPDVVRRNHIRTRIVGIVEADVGTPEGWEKIKAQVPSPTHLINAAGTLKQGPLFLHSPQEIQSIVQTNLIGAMLGVRAYSRAFMKWGLQRQRHHHHHHHDGYHDEPSSPSPSPVSSGASSNDIGGVIVNISSLLAVRGGRGAAPYAASKAGLVAFTRAMAAELGGFGIRVNAVLPGLMDSGMGKEYQAEDDSIIPLGRRGTAEEIASAVLFLCQNQYATNCILNLDGGLSAVDFFAGKKK